MKNERMPVGTDDFSEMIKDNFYYVDKTIFIKDLLLNWGKVNLFTRPRRFGKSINMSMLKYFFDIDADKSLFDGLKILNEKELCEKYMGQYPVISISLKQVNGSTFKKAEENIRSIIAAEACRLSVLPESSVLDDYDKNMLEKIKHGEGLLDNSIFNLSYLLKKHYNKKVIILIDEYDTPIQKAYENGYYDEMVGLIRQIFGYALKSNEFLYFSVLTGCMRVSKESIFSDLNNAKVFTMLDERCAESFGFTDDEVRQLLDDLGLNEYHDIIKNWYDGYRIGKSSIYCPWDVINYCDQILSNSDTVPQNFWANSSENGIVYQFVDIADETTKFDLETLSNGGSVDKDISLELTYKDINSNIDNLWSVLFTSGYLTQHGRNDDGTYNLVIPNNEIKSVFSQQIKKWFFTKIEGGLQKLYTALKNGSADEIEACINTYLRESISFMDGGNTETQKESFYHGLLLGMLKGCRNYVVKSNREAGNGRADIILIDRARDKGIIIEVKYAAKSAVLDDKAQEALRQIDDMRYEEFFAESDIEDITKYGIAFSRRKCRVIKNN